MPPPIDHARRGLLSHIGAAGLALAGLGAGGCAQLAAIREQGICNPCLGELPLELATHPLVESAWKRVDASKVWDCHAHLLGNGDSGSNVWLNPRMSSWLYPLRHADLDFYLNAACTRSPPGVDVSYIERIRDLVRGMRPGFKVLLLAFDHKYLKDGSHDTANSTYYTPNDYARDLARRMPECFEWVASIHPYRKDCVQALENASNDGAVAVKWLPNAMGIDPAADECVPFYEALARLKLPLISHAGDEKALLHADQTLGNPLLLRRALDKGVRVIVAHCASLGDNQDLDTAGKPLVPNILLFERMMNNKDYIGRLFGDISAVCQFNRAQWLPFVLRHTDWHERLLNGSDYPLPGVMPIYWLGGLAKQGLIEREDVPALTQIRKHNPLLFDFVLKRRLNANGSFLPEPVFETRNFFTRAGSPAYRQMQSVR